MRRKLQKKAKHKPYRKCRCCGQRTTLTLIEGDHDGWHLYKHCGGKIGSKDGYLAGDTMECLPPFGGGCGAWAELFWSGGGKADTYPRSPETV